MLSIPFLDLPPMIEARGTVRLPGSKSISNRVLLLAGLSEGTTSIRDLLESDDTRVMLDALRVLGCDVQIADGATQVAGIGGRLRVHEGQLFLGNAGTAMRPLTAALALMCQRDGGSFELRGVPRMHERPIADLVDALRSLGCGVEYLGQEGYPPLRVHADGNSAADVPRQAPIRVRGDVSSQFLSALLMALPLATRAGPLQIEVVGELISKPYVEITLNLLARFGVRVSHEGWQRFTVPQGCAYRSPGLIQVEGDASSASYFIGLGAIAAVDAPLRIEGVGSDSIQGDIRFVDAAQAMGAHVESGPGWLAVRRDRWPLRAIELDCNHIPDAAMTLALMALYADGKTRLTNIASWRVKETDRIFAMATELRRLGAAVVESADSIEVSPPVAWRAAAIHTYDDHRMAMSFALAALNPLAGAVPHVPVRILDPRCVGKTFPDYFETLLSVASVRAFAGAGDHRRRSDGIGQGHVGKRRGTGARLPPPRFGRALSRDRPRRVASEHADRRRAGDGCRGGRPRAAFQGRSHAALRRGRHRCPADRERRRAGIARFGLSRGARGAARPAVVVSPRARPGRRWTRYGHRHFSWRAAQGLPHRKRGDTGGATA